MEKTESRVDILEHGTDRDGTQRTSDRRLFMQLQVLDGCFAPEALLEVLDEKRLEGVLYRDASHPRRVGLLTMQEDPTFFATGVPELLNTEPFRSLIVREELTMTGRTYASGYEPNLEDWLLAKPRRAVLNRAWPWAVWYPLRRKGAFYRLPDDQQKSMLREHGAIGRSYAEEGLAQDVRLACHGIDTNDNEFVIGLVGRELFPLSHLVQRMRKTRQTAEYIESMGPFFVGYAVWQGEQRGS